MKAELILKNYEIAKERYAALGVDTDKAIETLEKTPISLHCWQADDVVGFERNEAASGGIQSYRQLSWQGTQHRRAASGHREGKVSPRWYYPSQSPRDLR